MCLDVSSHNAIVGLCKNNLKVELHSLIVGIWTKTMARLIEAVVEAKGIPVKLKKSSSQIETAPLAVASKDSTAKPKVKARKTFSSPSKTRRKMSSISRLLTIEIILQIRLQKEPRTIQLEEKNSRKRRTSTTHSTMRSKLSSTHWCKHNKIELSLVKRPEQAGQVNDPTTVSSTGSYHIP